MERTRTVTNMVRARSANNIPVQIEEEDAKSDDSSPPLRASQQTWITLDGPGGQSEGELLVSFLFVKVT